MRKLSSDSLNFSRFRAIAFSLGRLAIAGTICGLGVLAIQYGDRVEGEKKNANLSGMALVSWVGMSFTFWGWGEYAHYQREREKRDRQRHFTRHLCEREQENLALQAQLDSDRQQWENAIVNYQVQLSEQIQRRQEIAWELEQTRKLLPEIEAISIVDDVLQDNQHLEAEKAELLQNEEVLKGRIQQLQQALDRRSDRELVLENDKHKIKRSIPLSQLTGFSSREVIRAFKRLGFSCDRQRGSHVTLKKHVNCVIPIKSELAPGTLKSALQQANISIHEFLESL
jgi:predicted RNA binding protein YcfA (HicA-like mRNA interferase family)